MLPQVRSRSPAPKRKMFQEFGRLRSFAVLHLGEDLEDFGDDSIGGPCAGGCFLTQGHARP